MDALNFARYLMITFGSRNISFVERLTWIITTMQRAMMVNGMPRVVSFQTCVSKTIAKWVCLAGMFGLYLPSGCRGEDGGQQALEGASSYSNFKK